MSIMIGMRILALPLIIIVLLMSISTSAEIFRRRRSQPTYTMGNYPLPNYPVVMMPNQPSQAESSCRFGNGGSDRNQLQCPDGIYTLGADGIYRKSQGQNFSGGTSKPMPNTSGRSTCVYGNNGQDTNTLECPDGIFTRGADGIFRPAKNTPQYSKGAPATIHDDQDYGSGVRKMPPPPFEQEQSTHDQNAKSIPRPIPKPSLSSVNKMPENSNHLLDTALNKCVNCHQSQDVSGGYKNIDSLKNHLPSMVDNTLENMIGRSNLSHEEHQEIKNYVQRERKEADILHKFESNPDSCYTTNEERAQKIASMPKVNKEGSPIAEYLAKAQDTGRMVFYDKASVPLTWQTGTKTPSQTDSSYSPSRLYTSKYHSNSWMYEQMGYHSDGAREFPWAHSAGTDISPNATSEKFFIPPAEGTLAKFVNRTRASDPTYFGGSVNVNGPQLGWNYEPGAVFGETLKVNGVAFEIRLRKKMPDGQWQMDVLRPFENPQELAEALKKTCSQSNPPEGCKKITSETIAKIANPITHKADRSDYINAVLLRHDEILTINITAIESTQEKAMMHELPELPKDVVKTLLTTTPFKSVFGKPWIKGPPPAWAPTSRSDFNIVPKFYFGAFIPLTQQACMKCHDSAGRHVDNFDPKRDRGGMFAPAPGDVQDRPRTWYDHIPGNDGILSFHPFSKQAVDTNAYVNQNAINSCLTKSKLFK